MFFAPKQEKAYAKLTVSPLGPSSLVGVKHLTFGITIAKHNIKWLEHIGIYADNLSEHFACNIAEFSKK